MKTNLLSKLGLGTAGVILLSTLGSLASAGPGPQYWNRGAAPAASATLPKAAAPACAGCKTTVIWTSNDRQPAGKGAPSATVAGKKHECALCAGTIVTEKGTTKDAMKQNAVTCVTLVCCK
jgi:hypothetical protein